MRAVKYLKNRFEFALKNKSTIRIGKSDLDALNDIISFYNSNYKNTHLEDALLLFYILCYWKVENSENEYLKMAELDEKQGVFKITGADTLLKRISTLIRPKDEIILEITQELWAHQAINNIPVEKRIHREDVSKLLDEVLELAKQNFPITKDLDNMKVKFYYPKSKSKIAENL